MKMNEAPEIAGERASVDQRGQLSPLKIPSKTFVNLNF